MPDYIYLLENRLSQNQQNALRTVRDAARDAQMNVFLTGSAVRDLTSGSSVRELEFSVQGDVRKLKQTLEDGGIEVWAEDSAARTMYLSFPGAVRVEVGSTKTATYPHPGKPTYHWASIQEDLRHRDFTVNAMALSLNEGSYGLLMDPLNGAADIEARTLRLVSNYGFLENPILLPKAIRLRTRLGWEMDERTAQRYENAKVENVINHISDWSRSVELEDIGHEEDALRVLKSLEAEGWMQHLFPEWTSDSADIAGLERLHETLVKLQMQGVNPDTSAASMELLTAKMDRKALETLKNTLARKGFVNKWNSLGNLAKQFGHVLLAKDNATPSATWKLLTTYDPEAVLWLAMTTKSAAIEEKYRNFFMVWPEMRQKIPYVLMQEMRIVPEIEGYQDLVQKIFLELIDGRLSTTEEMREFLKPHSPPAPPPPVTIKRSRGGRKALAGMKAKVEEEEEEEEELERHGADTDFDSVEELEESEFLDSGDHDQEIDEEREEEEVPSPPVSEKKVKAAAPVQPEKKVAEKKPVAEAEEKPPPPAKKPVPPTKEPAPQAKAKEEPKEKEERAPATMVAPSPVVEKAHVPAKAAVATKAGKPPVEAKKAEPVKHEIGKKHEAVKKKEPVKAEAKKAAPKKQEKPAPKKAEHAVKPAAKKAVVKPAAKPAGKPSVSIAKAAAKKKKR
jgi:tRNA nucleotidyltransferase (CCA-adding enzyme)